MNNYSEWEGLRLKVFRASGGDFTNGGVTCHHDYVTVIGLKFKGHNAIPLPKQAQAFPATEDAPAVFLCEGGGGYGPHLEPVEGVEGHVGPMMGGNYAAASDSRWAELGGQFTLHGRLGAVPVHDRFESAAQYRALSSD